MCFNCSVQRYCAPSSVLQLWCGLPNITVRSDILRSAVIVCSRLYCLLNVLMLRILRFFVLIIWKCDMELQFVSNAILWNSLSHWNKIVFSSQNIAQTNVNGRLITRIKNLNVIRMYQVATIWMKMSWLIKFFLLRTFVNWLSDTPIYYILCLHYTFHSIVIEDSTLFNHTTETKSQPLAL